MNLSSSVRLSCGNTQPQNLSGFKRKQKPPRSIFRLYDISIVSIDFTLGPRITELPLCETWLIIVMDRIGTLEGLGPAIKCSSPKSCLFSTYLPALDTCPTQSQEPGKCNPTKYPEDRELRIFKIMLM